MDDLAAFWLSPAGPDADFKLLRGIPFVSHTGYTYTLS